MRTYPPRRAINRIEAVVIVAIGVFCVAGIVLFLVPLRENGLRVQCADNLRRQGVAIHSFADAKGKTPFLPPARIADGYATWAVLLAPHLTSDKTWAKWDMSRTYFAQPAEVRTAVVPVYFCPARPRTSFLSTAGDIDPATQEHVTGAVGDYAGVAGTGDPAHPWDGPDADGSIILGEVLERDGDRIVRWRGRTSLAAIQQARGTSATLLIGEKHVPIDHEGQADAGDGSLYDGASPATCTRVAGPGFALATAVTDPFNRNFGSAHPKVCQFLQADGSVRAFAPNVSPAVLAQLARREK